MINLSAKDEKLICSLQQKKFRKLHQLFVVEGDKMLQEAIASRYTIKYVVGIEDIVENLPSNGTYYRCDTKQMRRLSSLHTPPGVLTVLEIPILDTKVPRDELVVVLEKIQDPGNMGTIIRTADAFGVKTIVCSTDTVDWYSPKVVQASMGSLFRMNVIERDLIEFLSQQKKVATLYATHLDGENIYKRELKTPATLVMGNESHGISNDVMKVIDQSLKIPIEGGAESFNVSIATAILLGEFRRQLSWQ